MRSPSGGVFCDASLDAHAGAWASRLVNALTAGPKGPALHPGQLVLWQAGQHVPTIADFAKDKRFGWVGLIIGTLKSEYRNGCWVGGKRFSA